MRRMPGVAAVVVAAAVAQVARGEEGGERHRPHYHFTVDKNWTNDPNGLVYFDGEYHLFYQYNPFGHGWGHMSWGHAVSTDLLHWTELPVAIPEEDGVMAFSGSAVVDWENTSGWGKDGKPPLVALYTGHRPADNHQFQRVAYSNDRGRTWTRVGTVIDLDKTEFRDPKVFWYAPKRRWVMVVSRPVERHIRIYQSPNLKDWTLASEFGPVGSTEGVWECPDLFPLKDAEGRTKWVMLTSVSGAAPAGGGGVQYFVGDFDGDRFTADPQGQGWLDFGPDDYAAVTWSDLPKEDGRRIVLGWMSNVRYAGGTPTSPWRGGMTVPRELSLVEGKLVQRPIRELEQLRGTHWSVPGGDVAEVNRRLQATEAAKGPNDIAVDFRPGDGKRFGIDVCVGQGQRTRIYYDVDRGELFVDRTRSGDIGFLKDAPTVARAKVPLRDGRLALRILVDASSVEVFADDGRVLLTHLVYPAEGANGVEVWSEGGGVTVGGLEGWSMKSYREAK